MAILLFDDFHLPLHANIAVAQGVKRASATQAPLADMTAPNQPAGRRAADKSTATSFGGSSRWL